MNAMIKITEPVEATVEGPVEALMASVKLPLLRAACEDADRAQFGGPGYGSAEDSRDAIEMGNAAAAEVFRRGTALVGFETWDRDVDETWELFPAMTWRELVLAVYSSHLGDED